MYDEKRALSRNATPDACQLWSIPRIAVKLTLHHPCMVSSETNAILCNLNMNSGCKVDASEELIQWSGRSCNCAKDWLSVWCHFEIVTVVD